MTCLEAIIKQFPLQVTSFRRPSPCCPRNFGIYCMNFLFRHHTWEFQVFGDGKTTQSFPGNRMHTWVVLKCQDPLLKNVLPMRFPENGQLVGNIKWVNFSVARPAIKVIWNYALGCQRRNAPSCHLQNFEIRMYDVKNEKSWTNKNSSSHLCQSFWNRVLNTLNQAPIHLYRQL